MVLGKTVFYKLIYLRLLLKIKIFSKKSNRKIKRDIMIKIFVFKIYI